MLHVMQHLSNLLSSTITGPSITNRRSSAQQIHQALPDSRLIFRLGTYPKGYNISQIHVIYEFFLSKIFKHHQPQGKLPARIKPDFPDPLITLPLPTVACPREIGHILPPYLALTGPHQWH
jgi:hypothetical protein